MTPVEQQIDTILRPSIEHMGFRLVRAKLMDVDGRRTLQIMVEPLDGRQIQVDDCAEISHTASALLDVNDPIEGAYHLEVTSPGIDRPLMNEDDFLRYAGFEAKVEAGFPVDGRKRWRGIIQNIEGGILHLEHGGEAFAVPMDKISQAKLVLTDALMEAYKQGKIGH